MNQGELADVGRKRSLTFAFRPVADGGDGRLSGVFATCFSRVISLESVGTATVGEAEDAQTFPRYEFRAVRARLNGVEMDGQYRLLDATWTLDATGKLDLTRVTNADSGEPLPRVAPMRLSLGLDAVRSAWAARAELDHAARQNRVPGTDTATAGYTLVDLSLSRNFSHETPGALCFPKLTNVGNRLACNASAVDTIRGLAPCQAGV